MTIDGDGRDGTPRGKVRPPAGLEPAGLEIVKRRAPLSLQEQTLYLSLVDELTNEKKPANLQETLLVEEIARNYVRLQRARRLETETLDKQIVEVQSRFPKPLEGGKALAIVFMEHGAQLESMQRKETKIEAAWYRAMAELDREQAARRNRESEPPVLADPKAKRIHLVRKGKRDSGSGNERA
jgi:hypothetical protein